MSAESVIRHLEEDSDYEDDLDGIDHASDDSGSSDEDEEEWSLLDEDWDDLRDFLAEDDFGYSAVQPGTEELRQREDPTFTGRKKLNKSL